MISNREIKGQIDELTEQNQQLTQQLQQIQELLQQKNGQSQNQRSQPAQSPLTESDTPQSQSAQPVHSGQSQSTQAQTAQAQKQSQTGKQQQSVKSDKQIADIANEFLQLRGLTSSLEQKMQQYTSRHTKHTNLSEEDVVNLVLSMMNGMIDWTIELVSRQSGQSRQGQL
ncbi:hypothetical protein [Paenibacillus xerothermodurans]|uniref:Uncharacterized protein n=1 Tax=Paenibacillus xerothermodurans TaxID=1977292 RepID=A0A2W1P6A9_PAEXE|nr:hypothetical protein [Paenibacillus xerothermodurans]PZE22598.1 hypothetical protein CBW46_002140 [Paenibacillus xerothermodurans]